MMDDVRNCGRCVKCRGTRHEQHRPTDAFLAASARAVPGLHEFAIDPLLLPKGSDPAKGPAGASSVALPNLASR